MYLFQGNTGSPGLKGESGDPGPQVKTLAGPHLNSELTSKSNHLNCLDVKSCNKPCFLQYCVVYVIIALVCSVQIYDKNVSQTSK